MSEIPQSILSSLTPAQIQVINRIDQNADTCLGGKNASIINVAAGFYEAHRIVGDLLALDAPSHACNYALANLMAYQVMLLELYIQSHPKLIASAVEAAPHIAEFLVNEVEKLRAAKQIQ